MSAAMKAVGDLGDREEFTPGNVRTDSRLTGLGDVFFCIQGERFDGHNFAGEALSRGAAAVVASRPLDDAMDQASDAGAAFLLVDDTVKALGRLAAYHRARSAARVVGVTGSAGKTTVKEWLGWVLGLHGPTAVNYRNLNNQIGLPMCMLEATGDEAYWVYELGISQPGDMDELGEILRPDIALVLNVGAAHLEGLGSVESVAWQKSKILEYLSPHGHGVISLDYPELVEAAGRILPGSLGFTCQGRNALVQAEYAGPAEAGAGRYRLVAAGEEAEVVMPLRGGFVAENIAAVAAVCHLLGLGVREVAEALASVRAPEQRFQCREVGELLVIDDSYNANPISMVRALQSAAAMAEDRPLVLVVGEMRELGSQAGPAHVQLGRDMAGVRPAAVFWHGGHAADVTRGLEEAGWPGVVQSLGAPDTFAALWHELGLDQGVILFKGSRSNRMEEYSAALLEELRA
jgi:UDP-N-acetylmuramoyl-tripeptide--D-alanyl-D-alanine ligase